jgi:ABC-type Zn2+ transport system substrate-binding protein/surface adhesin
MCRYTIRYAWNPDWMAEHGVSKQVRRGWIAWSGLTFVRVLMGSTKFRLFSVAAAALLLFTSACERDTGEVDGRMKVVVTTNIVGDVVGVIGGDLIDLKVLLPVNSDPHSFEPTPRDVVAITDADLIFTSGAGLEGFLDPLLETASGEAELVSLSDDIELLVVETDHEGDLHGDGDEGGDPHVWFDPSNVIIWAETVSRVLFLRVLRPKVRFYAGGCCVPCLQHHVRTFSSRPVQPGGPDQLK